MSITKIDNGTWTLQFYFRDHTGTRHHKKKIGFKRKKDAEQWERDFFARLNGQSHMTFGALADLYLQDTRPRVKPTTYDNKKNIIMLHLVPYFGHVIIDDISPAMVRDFQTHCMTALSPTTGRPYSKTFLRSVNSQLSAVLNFAVRFYGLSQNPVKLTGAMGTLKSGRMDFYTLDEFNAVLKCVDNLIAKAALNFMFWSGCRAGETLALTWNDFDIEACSVSITKNFQHINGKSYISTPKTEKSKRDILLPSFVIDDLTDYKNRLYDYQDNERLFAITRGRLLDNLHRAADKAGVKQIRLHDLRHSHASMLINLGASPVLVADRLGHENVETTLKIYAHLWPDEQEKIKQKLEAFAEKSGQK